MQFESEIEHSIRYLTSSEANRTVEADAYWPKWHSPWWHMLLLHEMGLTALIPDTIVERYVSSLNRIPLKVFPILPDELPPGIDPFRGTPCHCQLGNVYQVLAARGIDVDAELPWIRPWFLKYQMRDGGLNCDNEAYLVTDECPSSMVSTIAAFEAVLLYTPRPWTPGEQLFLDKGANFLIARELRLGSSTKHNASEQTSAENWTLMCFPRFYLYDVLRGLNALALWAEKTQRPVPSQAIRHVFSLIENEFPTGEIRIGRRSFAGAKTLKLLPTREWTRGHDATTFPLLDAVSAVGDVSPFLTRQWSETRLRLSRIVTL
jgi:hypothetical protein